MNNFIPIKINNKAGMNTWKYSSNKEAGVANKASEFKGIRA